mmetsp:Transcript_46622/g.123746  ORF Transcript_46622/g.123746 Transcript_46622/m.123746 type:complete len:150 (-) Transcript_46622:537-986(-)
MSFKIRNGPQPGSRWPTDPKDKLPQPVDDKILFDGGCTRHVRGSVILVRGTAINGVCTGLDNTVLVELNEAAIDQLETGSRDNDVVGGAFTPRRSSRSWHVDHRLPGKTSSTFVNHEILFGALVVGIANGAHVMFVALSFSRNSRNMCS